MVERSFLSVTGGAGCGSGGQELQKDKWAKITIDNGDGKPISGLWRNCSSEQAQLSLDREWSAHQKVPVVIDGKDVFADPSNVTLVSSDD